MVGFAHRLEEEAHPSWSHAVRLGFSPCFSAPARCATPAVVWEALRQLTSPRSQYLNYGALKAQLKLIASLAHERTSSPQHTVDLKLLFQRQLDG